MTAENRNAEQAAVGYAEFSACEPYLSDPRRLAGNPTRWLEAAYDAGAASRQVEVDKLRWLLRQWFDAYPEGDKLMIANENTGREGIFS